MGDILSVSPRLSLFSWSIIKFSAIILAIWIFESDHPEPSEGVFKLKEDRMRIGRRRADSCRKHDEKAGFDIVFFEKLAISCAYNTSNSRSFDRISDTFWGRYADPVDLPSLRILSSEQIRVFIRQYEDSEICTCRPSSFFIRFYK